MGCKQKINRVERGWAAVYVYNRRLIHADFVIVLCDGSWGWSEMWASGMVGVRRLTGRV